MGRPMGLAMARHDSTAVARHGTATSWHSLDEHSSRHRFGVVLGSFWGRFGVVLGSFWDRFGISLGSFLDQFGISLGSVWGHFGGPMFLTRKVSIKLHLM